MSDMTSAPLFLVTCPACDAQWEEWEDDPEAYPHRDECPECGL